MAVSRISKEDLKPRLDGDEAGRPVLADVRRKYAWDHSTLKLPGAIRLDPKAPSAAGLPKDRDLVVYCSDPDEITSVEVASGLAAAGFRVEVLKGGLPEWVAANLPADTKDAVRAVPPPAPPAPPAPAGQPAAPKS
ncbi:MAG: rhodanese-like domain-containing protein [Vicinamibacterales bacterium]